MVLRAIGDITVADAAGHAGDIRGRQWHHARPDDGSASARCATIRSHNSEIERRPSSSTHQTADSSEPRNTGEADPIPAPMTRFP